MLVSGRHSALAHQLDTVGQLHQRGCAHLLRHLCHASDHHRHCRHPCRPLRVGTMVDNWPLGTADHFTAYLVISVFRISHPCPPPAPASPWPTSGSGPCHPACSDCGCPRGQCRDGIAPMSVANAAAPADADILAAYPAWVRQYDTLDDVDAAAIRREVARLR